MTVVIRMKRTGRKNRPCYRISVTDRRFPRDGKTIERLGLYDPLAPDPETQVHFDQERARYWLSVGAQPSDTVRSIFKRAGLFEGRGPLPARKRPGRNHKTATGQRKQTAKAERATLKVARHAERVAAKRAAAKAAAESGEAEE